MVGGRTYLQWSAGPAVAGSPTWPCTAVRWPRRTGVSSLHTRRLPRHLGKEEGSTSLLPHPALPLPHPALPPSPPPTGHAHAGHSPRSTMRSPSFREAPCPAQILFIWATRARLPFSLASSSSLAAGLRTHTTWAFCPDACGHRGRAPASFSERAQKMPGGVTDHRDHGLGNSLEDEWL